MSTTRLWILLAALSLVTGEAMAQGMPCDNCRTPTPVDCRVDRETVARVTGCRAGVVAAWDGFSAPEKVESCIATLPPSWMLVDLVVRPISSNNGSHSISRFARGVDLEYKKTIDSAYESAIEVAQKIADPKEKQEAINSLKSKWKSTLDLYEKLKSNQDGVRLEVRATPHGSPFDRKRGWEEVWVDLLVMCVAPANLFEQVMQESGLQTPDAAKRSVRLENTDKSVRYVAWRPVDRFTRCETIKSDYSVVAAPPGSAFEFGLDPQFVMCFGGMHKLDAKPQFSSKCIAKAEDKINIGQIPTDCRTW